MYEYKAHITNVYDADTVTADIDLGFGIWMKGQKLRLFGINAPEMRGKEKKQGTVSRDFLREQILDKEVIIETIKGEEKGKYGRWLGIIYINQQNINDLLVEDGYAKQQDY